MFLAILAGIILVQLIPLPPDLWVSLPGRERYAEAAAAAGIEQPWRPISLTPDLTLNSLLALLPALTVLVGLASIREDQRSSLLPLLVVAACLSAVVGVFQLASEATSPLYLYDVTNRGSPVGFFSNRNHQAAFFAAMFPVLRIWTLLPHKDPHYRKRRLWIAAGVGLFLIPMILVTGSRAGMALGLLGIAIAFLLGPPRRRRPGEERRWAMVAARVAIVIIPVALIAAVILFGRAVALDRLIALEDSQAELRISSAPVMMDMTRDFFPWGTGFGSFDKVFRNFEPDAALSPFYFNHAHNDLLELAITGGLPALLLLVAFALWVIKRALPAFRSARQLPPLALLARLGAAAILLLLIASLVDYPLRTPLMSAFFALACGWLASFHCPPASHLTSSD